MGDSFPVPTAEQLFPAVGLDINGHIRINLGSRPFAFLFQDSLSSMFTSVSASHDGPSPIPRLVRRLHPSVVLWAGSTSGGSEDGEPGSWQGEDSETFESTLSSDETDSPESESESESESSIAESPPSGLV